MLLCFVRVFPFALPLDFEGLGSSASRCTIYLLRSCVWPLQSIALSEKKHANAQWHGRQPKHDEGLAEANASTHSTKAAVPNSVAARDYKAVPRLAPETKTNLKLVRSPEKSVALEQGALAWWAAHEVEIRLGQDRGQIVVLAEQHTILLLRLGE